MRASFFAYKCSDKTDPQTFFTISNFTVASLAMDDALNPKVKGGAISNAAGICFHSTPSRPAKILKPIEEKEKQEREG